jgi:hypothetical protein
MLCKAEIEKQLIDLQEKAKQLGLEISEFEVLDGAVVRELEKCDVGGLLNRRRKPIFVSPANYHGIKLKPNEIGFFHNIRFRGPDK